MIDDNSDAAWFLLFHRTHVTPPASEIRITEDNEERITEDGEERVTE